MAFKQVTIILTCILFQIFALREERKECYDTDPECLSKQYECAVPEREWVMRQTCAKTCEYCIGPTVPTSMGNLPKCQQLDIEANSAATTLPLPTAPQAITDKVQLKTSKIQYSRRPACKDRIGNCDSLPMKYCNTIHLWHNYMKNSCKKYCKFC